MKVAFFLEHVNIANANLDIIPRKDEAVNVWSVENKVVYARVSYVSWTIGVRGETSVTVFLVDPNQALNDRLDDMGADDFNP